MAIDLGTPELHMRQQVIQEGEGRHLRARVVNDPIALYHNKGFIDPVQYSAGLQLFADWVACHKHHTIMEKLLSNVSFGKRYGMTRNDFAGQYAYRRYHQVLRALNRISRHLAEEVIIKGRALNALHEEMGWQRANSGMDRLKEALDEIDDLYLNRNKISVGNLKKDVTQSEFCATFGQNRSGVGTDIAPLEM